MPMKKTIAILCAILVSAGALSACGSNPPAASAPPAEAPAPAQSAAPAPESSGAEQQAPGEPTTLVIWSRDRHDEAFIRPRVDEYNATNDKNVFVSYEVYTDNYELALDMAYATNSGPDMAMVSGYTDIFSKYVSNGQYISIDEFMTDEEKSRYGSLAAEGIDAYEGKLYYIPMFGSTGRLFYNEGIFERCGLTTPPTNLTELVEYSKIITDQLSGEGIYGFASNLSGPASALQRSVDFMVQRSGGPKQGFDFNNGTYDFSFYKPFMEAWRQIFAVDESAFPGCDAINIDTIRTQFAAGKIGMYISWSHADPGVYQNQFPTTEVWNVAQLPVLDGADIATQAIAPYKGALISKKCKDPELAWQVCKDLFYNDEYALAYHEAGLAYVMIPDLQGKANNPELLNGKEENFLGDNDKLWPATPHELSAQAVVVEGDDQWKTFAAMIWGALDIDSGLEDLTNRYNNAYQKGIADGLGNEVKIPGFDPKNP